MKVIARSTQKAELAAQFNTTVAIISKIKNIKRCNIRVKEFLIYDISNKEDPLVIEMEKMLADNPTYEKVYWRQQGPCSNWGYDVIRPETNEEWNARIQREILKYT